MVAVIDVLCLLGLASVLPWISAPLLTETSCGADQFYDQTLHRCRQCSEVCHPLQGTMGECRRRCPDTYCPFVCNSSNNMMADCFGKVCSDYAKENVSCSTANTSPPSQEDPSWLCKHERKVYIVAVFLALCLALATYVCGYCHAKYAGKPEEKVTKQEAGFDVSKDILLVNPTVQVTPTAGTNGATGAGHRYHTDRSDRAEGENQTMLKETAL